MVKNPSGAPHLKIVSPLWNRLPHDDPFGGDTLGLDPVDFRQDSFPGGSHLTMPAQTPSGLSATSRTTRTGLPQAGAFS
jgi:hypothetical protein